MINQRLRWLFFLIGLALLVWLFYQFDLRAVIAQLRAFRVYFVLLIILSFIKNCIRTLAWQLALGTGEPRPGFWILFWVRLAGEAAAYLSSGNLFVGEPLKVMLVRDRLHLETGIASVLLERAIYSFTAILVLLAGLLYALTRFSASDPSGVVAIITSLALGVVIAVAIYGFMKEWPVFSLGARSAGRLPWIGKKLSAREQAFVAVELRLYTYRRSHPTRFYLIFALDLLFNLTTVLEVLLIFLGLGAHIKYQEALLVEALTKANNLLFFVPAGVGTHEAINIVLARMLNQSDQTGFMVALIRRFYILFWVILGLFAFFTLGRKPKSTN